METLTQDKAAREIRLGIPDMWLFCILYRRERRVGVRGWRGRGLDKLDESAACGVDLPAKAREFEAEGGMLSGVMMEEALKVAAAAVLVGKESGDEVAGGYRSGELPPALLEPGLYGSELGAPILVVACDLSMHELFVDAASLAAAEPLREPANAAHHQWTAVRTHQARHYPHRDRFSFCSNTLRTDRWDAPPRARQRSVVTWSLTDLRSGGRTGEQKRQLLRRILLLPRVLPWKERLGLGGPRLRLPQAAFICLESVRVHAAVEPPWRQAIGCTQAWCIPPTTSELHMWPEASDRALKSGCASALATCAAPRHSVWRKSWRAYLSIRVHRSGYC
jgi:hypothetical protein